MSIILGIDCGATNLRVGLVTEDGELLDRKVIASPLKHEPERLADKVKVIVSAIGDLNQIEGIGIGVPGPLDIEKGLILPSSNIGNVTPINLRIQFERLFSKKIQIDRDTNVALIGEAWKGGAVGFKNVIMLTLGSGVGGAIMEHGEIEHGSKGRAGELGHMILSIAPVDNTPHLLSNASVLRSDKSDLGYAPPVAESRDRGVRRSSPSAPSCGLGHEGCLEALINSTDDLDEIGTYLGYGLVNIVDIFNPEKVLIGGGKIRMGDFLTKAIAVMKEVGMKPAVDEVSIEYAKLKDMAGVLGAAKLVYDSNKNT